ncbi:hypothetical protein AAHC03_017170 [Spirometra sp. Aus1]
MHNCQTFDQGFFQPNKKPCFAGNVETEIVAHASERVELQCFIFNVNFSITLISWWKNNDLQELTLGLETHDPRFKLSRRFMEDWSLVISDVRLSDSGYYSCQINFDDILEKVFRLSVKEKQNPNLPADGRLWRTGHFNKTHTEKAAPNSLLLKELKPRERTPLTQENNINAFYNDATMNDQLRMTSRISLPRVTSNKPALCSFPLMIMLTALRLDF